MHSRERDVEGDHPQVARQVHFQLLEQVQSRVHRREEAGVGALYQRCCEPPTTTDGQSKYDLVHPGRCVGQDEVYCRIAGDEEEEEEDGEGKTAVVSIASTARPV